MRTYCAVTYDDNTLVLWRLFTMKRSQTTERSGRYGVRADDALDRVTFHAVELDRWGDLEQLFESRGGPKNCWCMVWRGNPEERRDKASKKAALERRVREGVPVGLLGYLDEEPVAWCSIAPRPTYRPLGGIEREGEAGDAVWSLVCFFVTRRLRGRGMKIQLLEAAIEHARERGAKVVEAYPVDRDSPSYRFMGFVNAFEAAGFREVGRAGSRRHVMRLELA